jgi:myo-inositol 2-dehydrogenase/D-chiro-inositol 1-dehydrogenase
VVIIASTTNTHYENICRSFAAQKAVFTEKPISHDQDEIDNVIRLAKSSALPFLVGFQRRFDINFVTLKQHVDTGAIGVPRVMHTTSRDNPEPPMEYLKVSGGIFHDMLCHDFDILKFVTGQTPSKVYSVGHCYNPDIEVMNDVDTAMCTFSYPSGMIANVNTSRISPYGYDQRIEAFGSLGMSNARNKECHNTTLVSDVINLYNLPLTAVLLFVMWFVVIN